MKQTLGEILYDARTEKKVPPGDLAFSAEVSCRAINDWENDRKSPSVLNLQKICKALHISIQINENGEVTRVK